MKYFDYLSEDEQRDIFFSPPEILDRDGKREILAYALGAALYMPADKGNIYEEIISKKNPSIKTIVLCLEDAIGDNSIKKAQDNVLTSIKQIHNAVENGLITYQELPFIFIRIRNPGQIMEVGSAAGEYLKILSGFVFPKFSVENAILFFEELIKLNHKLGKQLYGMPILESKDIIYKEVRAKKLYEIKNILDQYYDLVLNIRIGATDFCSQFGIRRSYDMTIYDIVVVRDCIADILNVFARVDGGYVVSGPVWEYFFNGDRVLKPQLRQSPFEETYGSKGVDIRKELLSKYLDGLIREVLMDKANGFVGKTIIHPTHIIPVQALQVVSHEEYMDACSIINNNNGEIGVIRSHYQNKMNEIKPHLNWARKTIIKSKIYGVFHEKQNFTNLFTTTKFL